MQWSAPVKRREDKEASPPQADGVFKKVERPPEPDAANGAVVTSQGNEIKKSFIRKSSGGCPDPQS